MKLISYFFSFSLALLLSSQIANAKDINVSVKSGAKTAVHGFALYNVETCSGGTPPKVSFKQPRHGKFSFVRSRTRIGKGKQCAGARLNGVTVYYHSNGRYRGSDSGKVWYSFPQFTDSTVSSKSASYTLNINVK